MNHIPNAADAASDLIRCIYASFSKEGFANETFIEFYDHSKKILTRLESKINQTALSEIKERLKKAESRKMPNSKRREDLLMVSNILLQS